MIYTQTCRFANEGDLKEVVKVHVAAFPDFFLTTLGPAFLEVMYSAFLTAPGKVFMVDESDGRLQGFAVGVFKSTGKDRKLAIKFFARFAVAILPVLMRSPIKILHKILGQLLTDRGQPEMPEGSIVLRSIAVLPETKGTGVGERLIKSFEITAKQTGARAIALTTDATNNERTIAFYFKHGYSVHQEFMQDKVRRMLLLIKNI
ncbi:GNAT family N-acetyltransferase [Noviherbaspirillum malthae]|uniref:GNAT family N-acetyltransferase n=1 Tax=Noviherbaspirillum malthae TaxID=1260987 RepID=UPI00188ECC3B|nr:GNAT family N-acetyltransferase [Noviherbaspirillum malthae]